MKKSPGPRGSRDEEFLVPSLIQIAKKYLGFRNLQEKLLLSKTYHNQVVATCDPHRKGPINAGNKFDRKCSMGCA